MYLIIYDNITGDIIGGTNADQDVEQDVGTFTFHFSEEKKARTSGIYASHIPQPTKNYKIVDGEIIEKTEDEMRIINSFFNR